MATVVSNLNFWVFLLSDQHTNVQQTMPDMQHRSLYLCMMALSVWASSVPRPRPSVGSSAHLLPPTLCGPGHTIRAGSSDECTQCAAGSFKDVHGTASCSLCPYAKFSNATGATSAATCTACPRLHYADKGSRLATDCVAPKPVHRVRRLRGTATCKATLPDCVDDGDCGGAARGTCSEGQCECWEQFRGRHCSFWRLGFDGENRSGACTLQRCSGHGRCRFSSICECDRGYVATFNYTCTACPAGTFSNRTGLTQCFKCPMHSHSPLASTSCTCNSGHGGRFGACEACAAGKYSNPRRAGRSGETSESVCSDCPAHTHSPNGSALMTNCICNKGFSGPDGGECEACAAGSFKDVNGSAACILCSPGKYSTATAATSEFTCENCPTNTYSGPGSRVRNDCTATSEPTSSTTPTLSSTPAPSTSASTLGSTSASTVGTATQPASTPAASIFLSTSSATATRSCLEFVRVLTPVYASASLSLSLSLFESPLLFLCSETNTTLLLNQPVLPHQNQQVVLHLR